MGLLRRNPYRNLPAPPAPGGPELVASVPSGRDVAVARLAPFTTPESTAVTRETVWQVPAFANGLQVIAGTIGALPLHRLVRGTWEEVTDEAAFLQQIDPEEPSSATLTRTVEDLVLYPYAYWVVLGRYASGYPMWARHVPAECVTPPLKSGDDYRVNVGGESWTVSPLDVIRFTSPTPGLLVTGARTVATSHALEEAARRYASEPMPTGVIKNEGADLTEPQIDALLDGWNRARLTRSTAYLNRMLSYEALAWDAEQMQLADGRNHQVAEAARLLNLRPKYVNAQMLGGSLTYSTTTADRQELVDLTFRPYLAAVEDRLTLGDVTPTTQVCRFDLDDFLRGDASERITVAAARIAARITSPAEERAHERIAGAPPDGPSTSSSTSSSTGAAS